MAITTAGKNHVAGLIIGEALTPFNAANAHIGVGDSSTAFAVGQTDLQAATNKMREPVDGAPGRTNNVLTFIATFESADANWPWNEWGIFNGSSGNVMLCRKVASHGTKASGDVWTMTADITVG